MRCASCLRLPCAHTLPIRLVTQMKATLASNDAVTDDAAGSAYIENFALKVFVGADNEDRSGNSTR